MKKKGWLVLTALAMFMVGAAAACMAGDKVKIVIDGVAIPSLQPRMEKSQVLIDAEGLARAMQAGTRWDKNTSTLYINRVIPVDEIRLSQLERALTTNSAEAAANSWAEAVGSRNGAWQYALLSPELKAKSDYASCNWVTGCSSPWVETYRVTPYHPEQSKAIQYQVDYYYVTSTGWAGHGAELLTVANQSPSGYSPVWVVTERQELPVNEIKGLNFENHAVLGDFNILSGLPEGWKLKTSAHQLLLLNQNGQPQGSMELIGGDYLPNHSTTLKQETTPGVYGQIHLALLNLTPPAASGIKSSQQAIYALVPLKDSIWLQLSLPVSRGDISSQTKLARDIAQTIIVFDNK